MGPSVDEAATGSDDRVPPADGLEVGALGRGGAKRADGVGIGEHAVRTRRGGPRFHQSEFLVGGYELGRVII
jgi:hypothetical protein